MMDVLSPSLFRHVWLDPEFFLKNRTILIMICYKSRRLPLLGPATCVGQSANTLCVLPQVAILGTLALGFPTTGLDGWFEAVDSGWAELDVGAGDVVAGHDGGGVFVPDGAEHVEAKG